MCLAVALIETIIIWIRSRRILITVIEQRGDYKLYFIVILRQIVDGRNRSYKMHMRNAFETLSVKIVAYTPVFIIITYT